jgi:hypothetical protein
MRKICIYRKLPARKNRPRRKIQICGKPLVKTCRKQTNKKKLKNECSTNYGSTTEDDPIFVILKKDDPIQTEKLETSAKKKKIKQQGQQRTNNSES